MNNEQKQKPSPHKFNASRSYWLSKEQLKQLES